MVNGDNVLENMMKRGSGFVEEGILSIFFITCTYRL